MKVLVVDDEPDARSLIRRILEGCGATVVMAASADEGMPLVRRERPDVIVSDVGMPERDGYEFMRQVRQLPPDEGGQDSGGGGGADGLCAGPVGG